MAPTATDLLDSAEVTDLAAGQASTEPSDTVTSDTTTGDAGTSDIIAADLLVEEISIDGMCGVY